MCYLFKILLIGLLLSSLTISQSYAQFRNSFLNKDEMTILINELNAKPVYADFIYSHNDIEENFIEKIRIHNFISKSIKLQAYRKFYLSAKNNIKDRSCFDSASIYFNISQTHKLHLYYHSNVNNLDYFYDVNSMQIHEDVENSMQIYEDVENPMKIHVDVDNSILYLSRPNKLIKEIELIYFLKHYSYEDKVTLLYNHYLGYFIIENDVIYSIQNGNKIRASEYLKKFDWDYISKIFNPTEYPTKTDSIKSSHFPFRLHELTEPMQKAIQLFESQKGK